MTKTLLVTTVIHKYVAWNWNKRCQVTQRQNNYKLKAIACAKSNSNSSARKKKLNVGKKRITEWRKSKDKFHSLRKKDNGVKRLK